MYLSTRGIFLQNRLYIIVYVHGNNMIYGLPLLLLLGLSIITVVLLLQTES